MRIELLLCPFCGGDARFRYGACGMRVECLGCGVRTEDYRGMHNMDCAVLAWNSREEEEGRKQ